MSEINDIEEIPESNVSNNLKLIQRYQQSEPILVAKYKNGTHHKGSFRGGINKKLSLIT